MAQNFLGPFLVLAVVLGGSSLTAQVAPQHVPLELTSGLGRRLYALPDDAALIAARKVFSDNPADAKAALALSKAQAARRQYNEAVATDTAALAQVHDASPLSADLYLERGHRELGLRHFAEAQADLEHAVKLNPALVDAYYHLALSHYFQGQFAEAAAILTEGRSLVTTDDLLIDYTAWLYVSLRRAGKEAEAAEALARITPAVKNTEPHLFFYLQLLHFYQGKLTAAQVQPPPPDPPGDLELELSFNTITYGVGNWDLYHRNPGAATKLFRKVVEGEAWNSWGFVGSETGLLRLGQGAK
jgi:tetratricopeptide (TPR) repeat protein